MSLSVLTVSQVNSYIKLLLDADTKLNTIFMIGEISNLADNYKSGHIYFSLKDDKSIIRCVMFSFNAKKLKFIPKNGMNVILRGRVSLYEATGQYQVYVEDMQPDGVGAITVAFEQTKAKLEKEGLFDKSHKKPLPNYPKKIGVITSKNGAVIEDIKNILNRRYKLAEIILYPVSVQGENSAREMIKALEFLDNKKLCDVIIIGRGGGSTEDLWSFNDEHLARTIYKATTPIISAVGHETDFSICDFVADVRAATPSMGAEIVAPDSNQLMLYISSIYNYLTSKIENQIQENREKVSRLSTNLTKSSPIYTLEKYYQQNSILDLKLKNSYKNIININKNNLINNATKLDNLSPLKTMQRGFSLASKDDKIINSTKNLKCGDVLKLNFSQGEAKCLVTEVNNEKEYDI